MLAVVVTALLAPAAAIGQQGAATGLSGDTRASFVQAAIASCMRKQIAAPENKGIADDVIDFYCICYSNGMADRLSPDDVVRLDAMEPADMQKAMAPAVEQSSAACLESVKARFSKK